MDRRSFLTAAVAGGGAAVLGGSLWLDALGAPGASPYGKLSKADARGIRLPAGFSSRVVARSGQKVAATAHAWHDAPDGGACFPAGEGWIYVSNSEVYGAGGVGAVRFDAGGAVVDAYQILSGSSQNCAGGATPWGTWLSCEERTRGYVWETFPDRRAAAVRRPAMGRFVHEAAVVDPDRRCVYLTEDASDGCLYRFVPSSWPSLAAGRLEVLVAGPGTTGAFRWVRVPEPDAASTATRNQVPGAKRFNGGEGIVYHERRVWFTTKGDDRVWKLNVKGQSYSLAYDHSRFSSPPLRGVDNIQRASSGELFVAEDGGDMEICVITPTGVVAPFLRVEGQSRSEITGPAFSPDGTRLYFSSQRGITGSSSRGITYEVRGPFRR